MIKTQHCPNCEATKQELSDFRQLVSDDVSGYVAACHKGRYPIYSPLTSFIIPAPKPDPLVKVLAHGGWADPAKLAGSLRATLADFGFEIREKNDDQ
jgi:hypothetical protein